MDRESARRQPLRDWPRCVRTVQARSRHDSMFAPAIGCSKLCAAVRARMFATTQRTCSPIGVTQSFGAPSSHSSGIRVTLLPCAPRQPKHSASRCSSNEAASEIRRWVCSALSSRTRRHPYGSGRCTRSGCSLLGKLDSRSPRSSTTTPSVAKAGGASATRRAMFSPCWTARHGRSDLPARKPHEIAERRNVLRSLRGRTDRPACSTPCDVDGRARATRLDRQRGRRLSDRHVAWRRARNATRRLSPRAPHLRGDLTRSGRGTGGPLAR